MATYISSIDFFKEFGTAGKTTTLENRRVDDRIEFNNTNYRSRYAILKNIEFQDEVIFNKVNVEIGLRFENCTFLKGLFIFNSNASGFDKEFDKKFDFSSLLFINCSASNLTICNNTFLERGFEIKESSKFNDVIISNVFSEIGSIHFTESEISGKFDITNCILNGSGVIKLDRCTVKSHLRFESLRTSGISFTENQFENNIHLWNITSTKGLTFNDNIFNNDVSIKGCFIKDYLSLNRDEFKKSLNIDFEDDTSDLKGNFEKIFIAGIKVGTNLIFNGASQLIKELELIISSNLSGTIIFNLCQFELSKVSGDNHKGNLVFNDCRFQKLYLNNFTNYGNLTFASCKAIPLTDSEFRIFNTNLGKTQLFNFYFNSFLIVNISDSLLSEIITSGVSWFTNDKLIIGSIENKDSDRRRREIYRQLKMAMKKQEDSLNSLIFEKEEMNAYLNYMRNSDADWSERFILWTNKESNNFGTDWVIPIAYMILSNVFFFITIGFALYGFNPKEYDDYLKVWSKFLVFFNPTHLPKNISEDIETNNFAMILDFFSRIVSGYFIFQTIRAFRKYSK